MVPGKGPRTAAEAREWSSWLVEATARGWVSEGVSQRLSTAINTFLRAHGQADLETKIEDLHVQLQDVRRGR
jgi:hypothetical protein